MKHMLAFLGKIGAGNWYRSRVAKVGALVISLTFASSAADRMWTGLGSDSKWTNPENWSAGLPTAADSIFFRGPWATDVQLVADTESTQRIQAKVVFENPMAQPITLRGRGAEGGVKTDDSFYFGCGEEKTANVIFDGGTYSTPYYNKMRLATPYGGKVRWEIRGGANVKTGVLWLGHDATNNLTDVTLADGVLRTYGAELSGVGGTNTFRVTGGLFSSVPWSSGGGSRIDLATKKNGLSCLIVSGGTLVATNAGANAACGIFAGCASNSTGRVEIRGGVVRTASIGLATNPFTRGEYYQDGGTFVNLGTFALGRYAAAANKKMEALAVFNGGISSNLIISIGHSRDRHTVGTMIVSNGVVCAEDLYVANSGTGFLFVEGGEMRIRGDVIQHKETGEVEGGKSTESQIFLNGGVLSATRVMHCLHKGNPRFSRLVFNGGTLRAQADSDCLIGPSDDELISYVGGVGNTNEYEVALNGMGGTIDTAGHAVVIPKALTGDGALTKIGAGTLELTGKNLYRGGTVVRGGSLVANAVYAPSVTLDGGSLFVPNRGEKPSVAALTVVSGKLRTEISPSACDTLQVAGDVIWNEDASLIVSPVLNPSEAIWGDFALLSGLSADVTIDRFSVEPVKGYDVRLSLKDGVLSARIRKNNGFKIIIR